MLKIDLHTHTTASDGVLSPSELVLRATNMQVNVLAITDHDTLNGLDEALDTIYKQQLKLELIKGIELSTMWEGKGIHIVGLNIDTENDFFTDFVSRQQIIRKNRAMKIGQKLEKIGFCNAYEQALSLAQGGEVTRAHFAKALVHYHGVASIEQAFKRFMGKGNVGDVKANWPSMQEAVNAIHEAGGYAVLAHPLKYDLSTKWLRKLIAHFDHVNGDGVEIAGPGVSGQKQQLIYEIVNQHNLKGSVGSDFHGPGRWTEVGRFSRISESIIPIWNDWQNSAFNPTNL